MNETIRYSVICLAVLLFYVSFAWGQKRAYATAQITATVVAALPAEMSLSVDKSGDKKMEGVSSCFRAEIRKNSSCMQRQEQALFGFPTYRINPKYFKTSIL